MPCLGLGEAGVASLLSYLEARTRANSEQPPGKDAAAVR